MNKTISPKITFGIIVLNGEPFTRYCLRSIYPFAHEIIVVEGGHENTRLVCTHDGHSIDGTLETLYKFKEEEDPENKLIIITRDGFWPKKDEFGKDRTPQSRAYAERATGDYLWQIDIDEFYTYEDMQKIVNMLRTESSITTVSFKQKSFWGDIDYISESYALIRNKGGWHRIFKWNPNYKYLTHQPPTVVDENGIDLRLINWKTGEIMKKKKIFMYHYSLLFPKQVDYKAKVYSVEKVQNYSRIIEWAENNYFKLNNPFRVHNLYWLPSWLVRFKGKHPEQISQMMQDIKEGKIEVKLRGVNDIEELLNSKVYQIKSMFLRIGEPFDRMFNQAIFNLKRIKNIPGKIRRILSSGTNKKYA
jgi:hypothetical protein